jgi:molybdenum cofactor sulfurtransferase
MCSISAYIDLNKGIMFVESPRCREKLEINLKTDSYPGGIEEIELHAQRYDNTDFEVVSASSFMLYSGILSMWPFCWTI